MSEWRPAKTAPKDGTRFLAVDASGVITVASVTGAKLSWDPEFTGEPKDWDVTVVAMNMSSQWHLSEFTHWQPLPTPPDTPDTERKEP